MALRQVVDEAWKNVYLLLDNVAPSRKSPQQMHKSEGALPSEREDTELCVNPFFFFFFLILFIYDSHIERERGRDIGRGRSRLYAPGARRGIRSGVSRITPWAKGRRQTAAPPRDPCVSILKKGIAQ